MPSTAGKGPRSSETNAETNRFCRPAVLTSIPALAAALRHPQPQRRVAAPLRTLLRYDPLVPMYQVKTGGAPAQPPNGEPVNQKAALDKAAIDEEAQAAAHVLLTVAERLRRLTTAYGEWTQFDAAAYFDLTEPQLERLVRVVERVTTVHVLFAADQLLPSFQIAAAYWQEHFCPGYGAARAQLALDRNSDSDQPIVVENEAVRRFAEVIQPQMVDHWQRLVDVVQATRALLDQEIAFWATNGGNEERARRRSAWAEPPAPGVDAALLPALAHVPTLTLAIDFPLPAYRQPGRLRRLRRSYAHRNKARRRSG